VEGVAQNLSRMTWHTFPIAVFKPYSRDSQPLFSAKSGTIMFHMTHLNANANLKPSLRQLIPSPHSLSKCIKFLVLDTSKMYRFLRAKQT